MSKTTLKKLPEGKAGVWVGEKEANNTLCRTMAEQGGST